MLSIAVCDDAALECFRLSNKIKEILDEMKIPVAVHQFCSGISLLEESAGFDIIFLDIMMARLDGMKTARLFRQKNFEGILIFVSSSREYVWDAYDVEAFYYLLKPVKKPKLKTVLQRALRKIQKNPQEYILICKERQQKKIFLDDIYYFEIKGRIINLYGTNGEFTYYERIQTLENRLQNKGFFRCHKSYLINLKYVSSYNRQEILLDNGEKIMIARRRYEDFCRELLAYMRNHGGIL